MIINKLFSYQKFPTFIIFIHLPRQKEKMNYTPMKKITRYLSLSLAFMTLGPVISQAQVKYFTLDQAVAYANIHNYSIINSGKGLELAKQKIKESIAEGLPQVNAALNYHDNIARPVFFLPGDLAGRPGQQLAVQFGTRYDANLTGHLSQLIFDGRYFVGLKAAKVTLEKSDKDFFKNKLAVKEQVSEAYFRVLSVKESMHIIDSTLAITRKLAGETLHIYKAGMTKETDVDQINLLVSNLKSSHTYLNSQYEIAIAFLKFYLGLGEKDSIVLTQQIPSLIKKNEREVMMAGVFNVNNNIDLLTVKTMKKLSKLKVMLAKAAYIPTINAVVNYETQAGRGTWNFFNSDKWYQSAVIGITMSIPILSSGRRAAQLKQAQIAFEQTQVLEKQTESQLNIQYKTLKSNYKNAQSIYANKDKNRSLAEKIYQKTLEKYRQGMASSLDLLNTHNQFLNAENDYISAGLNLFQSSEKLLTTLTKAN